MTENVIPEKIIGCAIEVHSHKGPGLLKSAYEACLYYELKTSGLEVKNNRRYPWFTRK